MGSASQHLAGQIIVSGKYVFVCAPDDRAVNNNAIDTHCLGNKAVCASGQIVDAL